MSQPPPNSNQQNMIQTIQPAQATRLLEALKEELAKAKAAGPDTTRARQHYARAEQIKQVLVNYRQQQQQRQAAAARASSSGNFVGTPATGGSGPSMSPQNVPQNAPQNVPQNVPQNMAQNVPQNLPQQNIPGSAPAHTNQAQFHNTNAISRPASTGIGAGPSTMGNVGNNGPGNGSLPQQHQQSQQQRTGIFNSNSMPNPGPDAQQRPPSVPPGVTPEKYSQVRARLQDLQRKITSLETNKRPDMSPEENTQFENQLRELKLKFSQYSKFAQYMQNQLRDLARNTGAAGPMGASPATQTGTPGLPQQAHASNSGGTPAQSVHTPSVTNPLLMANNAPLAQDKPLSEATVNMSSANMGTPNRSGSRGLSPSMKEPTVPGVNLSLITKPSVPSIPILSTINVNPQNPFTLKPGANNVRPTLTAGGSSGLGQVINSPAMTRMPTFDMASTGPIQDNGGRVLTKRKLTELVNTIGADEGDGKTTIDGDVEELLLDLADEFVSSVTTFACRLAKHRKTDAIDVRDVQLHLERNWNIRIPGHAMDDIRSMRKWQPSTSYTQKVSGVDIVKAVNGNIN